MTLGDIIEKIRALFGGEPAKVRKFRERIAVILEKIKGMEDGLRELRKKVTALEERIADLKRELQVEKGDLKQDLIMDEIDGVQKEFDRVRELANLKTENLNAARALRSKLEQMLEQAANGANSDELEDVLAKVEDMDADLSDIRKLVAGLDKPTKSVQAKPATKSKTEDADRAARRARILGEKASAPAAKPSAEKKPSAVSESKVSVDAQPASAPTAEAAPGVAVAQ